MTYQDLLNKWGADFWRDNCSFEEEVEYVNDWYEVAKTLKRKPFETKYSEYSKYNEQTFEIVGTVTYTNDNVDIESLPLWKIKMPDGQIIWADCDEIFDFNENNDDDMYPLYETCIAPISREEAKEWKTKKIQATVMRMINESIKNNYDIDINITTVNLSKLRETVNEECSMSLNNKWLFESDLFNILPEYKKIGWNIFFDKETGNYVFS